MRPELCAKLTAIMRGNFTAEPAVTPVTPVTHATGHRSKSLKLQSLQKLQVKNSKTGKAANRPVAKAVTSSDDPDAAALEERKAMAADSVPERYLDGWARLQLQRPVGVDEARWRQAINDAGRFLDIWGTLAAELGFTPGDVLDVPRSGKPGGLAWFANGSLVAVLNQDGAKCVDGRIWRRVRP